MGKLIYDPYINHFSHPHPLELFNPQTLSIITPCSACKLQSSGWMYICKLCNFTLHISCSKMPTLITHPAHPIHPLTLLPTPAYPSGVFNCDGCGHQGHGFSYHCTHCDFDVHMTCASNPLSLTHQSHPHQLNLIFHPPYQTKGFSCDICQKIGSNHWLYRCGPCEFDAHLDCATGIQPQLQHHNSFPGSNQYQAAAARQAGAVNSVNYLHSQRTGAVQTSYQQPTGAMQANSYLQPNGPARNAIMDAMVQGFVDGAAQQAGQMFVQSIMNDGNTNSGNNSDPNGGADISSSSSTPSIISIGSSILNGMFGDSNAQN